MIRLFTAIEIPELIRSQLTALQVFDSHDWDANWMEPDSFHVTVAYIGEVEEPLADDIDAELRQLRLPAFELELKGVGAFGGARPHLLYAAAAKPAALEHIVERHKTALRRLGVPVESRKYSPHVTLARPRQAPPERVQAWIAANNLYASGPFPVDQIVLFSSHKVSGGRHYEPERQYPLRPAVFG